MLGLFLVRSSNCLVNVFDCFNKAWLCSVNCASGIKFLALSSPNLIVWSVTSLIPSLIFLNAITSSIWPFIISLPPSLLVAVSKDSYPLSMGRNTSYKSVKNFSCELTDSFNPLGAV